MKMSLPDAWKKLKLSRKSIWDIDGASVAERIQERRDRIKKRMEAAKRMQKLLQMKKMLGVFKEVEDDGEIKEFVISQLESSCGEAVTNIPLSSRHSFGLHLDSARKRNREMKEILSLEEDEVRRKFEEIEKKWNTNSKIGPTTLFQEMIKQKEECYEVLDSKNKIIEILEDENKKSDEAYKDLMKDYDENLFIMSVRMESHCKTMEEAIASEIKNIEDALENQKRQFLKNGRTDLKKSLDSLELKSKTDMEYRLSLLSDQGKELEEVLDNDSIMFAETKEKLGENIAILNEQINLIRAVTHLNVERLDYEINILHKHEQENSIIKSEQKRKLTNLQDVSNKLRLKLKEADRDSSREKTLLLEGIKRTKSQLSDLEVKQRKFSVQSARTRSDMARVMMKEASQLLSRITINDEILQKVYLKEPFVKKGISIGRNLFNKMEMERRPRSMISVPSLPSLAEVSSSMTKSSMADDTEDPEDLNVKRILRTFIDKADFLVDEDLNSMMKFMEDKDKLLVKIGSILGSLGVTEISELERIIQHLGKLSHLDSAKRRSKVLQVVREFVEEPEAEALMYQKQQAMMGTLSVFQSVVSTIQPDREGQVWEELRDSVRMFYSPDRANLKTLLTKYKDILLARAHLLQKNKALKKQNAEMRKLLESFL